jgi:GNAT superfamily N-acetyltransferase
MIIHKVISHTYADFIAKSQVAMALETEDYKLDLAIVSKGVQKVIETPSLGHYYIALIDEKPVACLLTVPEWSDWRNSTVLWIHSVYVADDFRRKGIYKRMYTHLKEMVLSSSEYAGLRLYVDKRNTDALEVYHRLGMESHHYDLCEWLKN